MSKGNSKSGIKIGRICPSCKSERVIFIVYGFPGPELIQQAKEGKVALGGCLEDEDNPRWKCKACEHEW